MEPTANYHKRNQLLVGHNSNVEEQIYVKKINSISNQNREKLNLVIKDHKWVIILITEF